MLRDMYKHILAALDGSPRSPQVLRQAAELCARTGATLHLCHAVNVPLGLLINFHEMKVTDGISRLVLPGAGQ